MRTFILSILCLLALQGVAQDRLVLTDGQEVLVWITEVGENYLKYIHADKSQTSEYNIPKRMVAKIIYASGGEKIFHPIRKSAPLPSSEPTIIDAGIIADSSTSTSSSEILTDVLHLMNGGIIEAKVTEINDLHIEYQLGENFHQVPVSEVSLIKYGDGSEEQFFQSQAPLDSEAARQASVAYRKKRLEVQDLHPIPETKHSSSRPRPHKGPTGPLELRLMGGLNLITGLGIGKRDLSWALKLAEATLPPESDANAFGEWNPTAGIHLGLLAVHHISSQVKLIGGMQISQKGFILLQTLSYKDPESGNRWIQRTREREQMVYLDFPIGLEVQLLPYLEVQAGLLSSVIVNGSTFIRTDIDGFDSDGSRLEGGSKNESLRQSYEGMAATTGGFFGIRVPISPRIGFHLLVTSNSNGGYEGAFTNTVIQLGAAYRL